MAGRRIRGTRVRVLGPQEREETQAPRIQKVQQLTGGVPSVPQGHQQDVYQYQAGAGSNTMQGAAGAPPAQGYGTGGGGVGGSQGAAKEVREGDWMCPCCSALVFASKNECFRCRAPKPPGAGLPAGSAMPRAAPAPNQVREGDWTCPSCRANVFASKMECFKCRAPRPANANVAAAAVGHPGGY